MGRLERNHELLYEVIPELERMDRGGTLTLTAPGFMDLHVEVVWEKQGGRRVTLSHYLEQRGDLVPDPDMEVWVSEYDETVEALTYQDQFVYRQAYVDTGVRDEKAHPELQRFLTMWLENLVGQGHEALEVRHD